MKSTKKDFPILSQAIHGKPLVYLDSSASSQKPLCVIDAVADYYRNDHSNIHRGVHELSGRATNAFEKTRQKIKEMIHAEHEHEIIFTSGTTDSINLVADSLGRSFFKANDEIILSVMEHHSNIVPWQMLEKNVGVIIKTISVTPEGELDLESLKKLWSERTKLLSIAHASNVLGTINPIEKIIAEAHSRNVLVLIDGAQAFSHIPVDVKKLDCDFYAFSAHKAYGPTGIGVLYGKTALLEKMTPVRGGGGMIASVTFEKTTYADLPHKFEAGTPPIASVVGFYSALTYLEEIGIATIMQHERELLDYATSAVRSIPGIRILGTAAKKVGVLSFTLDDIHPHDIGTILDREGVAVRAGHHCAMPLMQHFSIPACIRASFGLYNSKEDIDALIQGLHHVKRIFA